MRRLAGLLLAPSLCFGATPNVAAAAAFDGRWTADIPAQNGCGFTGTMSLVISGHDIAGEVQNSPETNVRLARLKGQINDDGSARFVVNGLYAGSMSFKGDRFEATWSNGVCQRHATGDRALDAARVAALAEERKRHQSAYADLMRRAAAGETVDYAALRAESIYAKDWDFYGANTRGLLDQANVAVKGKDCGQALPILDQVIRLDFTIDSAHALKADCLKQTGQPDKARIEDGVAKGLIHSLMDGFGGPHGLAQALTGAGGSTEEAAYVVHSYREEMDVLANRHIQLKTRQTEIRGSNGRYYDLIQGVSIARTGQIAEVGPYVAYRPGTVASVRNVYFDITSFVTGRVSRRAAAQALAEQLQ